VGAGGPDGPPGVCQGIGWPISGATAGGRGGSGCAGVSLTGPAGAGGSADGKNCPNAVVGASPVGLVGGGGNGGIRLIVVASGSSSGADGIEDSAAVPARGSSPVSSGGALRG
jgi:hypothetical protein